MVDVAEHNASLQKKVYFWVEGEDENQKLYFNSNQKFLTFLENNDPCLCGADVLTKEQFDMLPSNQDT